MSTATTTPSHTPDGDVAPPKATAAQWAGLAIMVIPLFMLASDFTVLFLAMPSITADLAPAGSQSLWILHISEYLTAATLITFGLLTRRVGARRLLLITVAIYGVASVVAAYSVNADMLIAARGVLGIAAAGFTPAGLVLIRNTFRDDRQYGLAFAIFMAAFTGGAAAGPPLGGLLLEYFWWGAVFLINVPVAAILLVGGPLLLPKNHADPNVRIDPVSVLLSVAGVLALVYGMQEMADAGPAAIPVVSAVLGTGVVILFFRRQRRSAHPLLDLSIFDNRVFITLMVLLVTAMLGMAVTDMLMTQHLQIVRGLSPWEAGLFMLAPAVGATCGTMATPLLTRWTTAATGSALALLGIGAASLAVPWLLETHGVTGLLAALTAMALFGSPFITLLSQLMIGSVSIEKTGQATAVQDVVASLGSASSIAFLGAGALWIHRTVLGQRAPEGIDTEVIDDAGQSFGASPALAQDLGPDDAEALIEAANTGLTTATQAGFIFQAGIALLLVIVVLLLRRVIRL